MPIRISKWRNSARYERPEGITSYLLLAKTAGGSKHLTVTEVRIEPGGSQRVHEHAPEQMYFILEGRGVMEVDEEKHVVGEGDCVFVPSGARHGIVNPGPDRLRYLSAAAPSFSEKELKAWSLGPEGA
jgi:mannose-6-phosphate isomerase-like protein (cupin superfamily)